MKTGMKQRKKICKNGPLKATQNDTSLKTRTKPMVTVFYRRRNPENSDKESSHDVGKFNLRG